jgi:hypothetical protein
MRWLTAFIVFTLAGCGLAQFAQMQQELDAAKLQLSRDWAECDRLYPNKARKPVTPRIKCQAAAKNKYYAAWKQATGNEASDIIIHEKNMAQALLAAERFDKGEISVAEYNLEAETLTLQRANDAAAVQAAQTQAAAASRPRLPRTTNCNTFGSTVNCTTY